MKNERNIEFMREHGKSIKVTLRNSRLTEDRLQQRMKLMRKSLISDYDKSKLDEIEKKVKDRIKTVGKNHFSEDEIDVIIRQTLGLEIRDYDKSYLVKPESEEITSIEPRKIPIKEMEPHIYGDTTISQFGRLVYKDWRGVEDMPGLSCYMIGKTDKTGNVKVYPEAVFSRINFNLMDSDIKYREAVLYTLLDENNIKKTNCGGYIGNIQTVEEAGTLEDTVTANSKYSLVFDSTDANVVAKFRQMVKEKNESIQYKSGGER